MICILLVIFVSIGRRGLKVEERLPGQFRHHRIGVAKEEDQHPDPAEFVGFNSNYWNGLGHWKLLSVVLIGGKE